MTDLVTLTLPNDRRVDARVIEQNWTADFEEYDAGGYVGVVPTGSGTVSARMIAPVGLDDPAFEGLHERLLGFEVRFSDADRVVLARVTRLTTDRDQTKIDVAGTWARRPAAGPIDVDYEVDEPKGLTE